MQNNTISEELTNIKTSKVSLEQQYNCMKQENEKLLKEKDSITKTSKDMLEKAEKSKKTKRRRI